MEIMNGFGKFAIAAVIAAGCLTAIPSMRLRREKGYGVRIENIVLSVVFGWVYLLYAVGLPLSHDARHADQMQLAKMIAKENAKRKE